MIKIIRTFSLILMLIGTTGCRPLLMLYIGKPYATKEKSIKTFTKIHPNTDDLFFYDQNLFELMMADETKPNFALLGKWILNSDELFLETAEDSTCTVGLMNSIKNLEELKLVTYSERTTQLNIYPEARERIQNFDGYTIVVLYSQMFRKKGVRIDKELADDYAEKHSKTQIIYLCTDFRE